MLLISHLVLFDITSRIYSQLLFVQYEWLAVVPTLPFIGCYNVGARSQNNILLLGSICGYDLLQQLSFFPPIFFKCNHICEASLLSNQEKVDGLTAPEPAIFLMQRGCSRQIEQRAISLLISAAQPSPRAERADISPSAAARWCLCWLLS